MGILAPMMWPAPRATARPPRSDEGASNKPHLIYLSPEDSAKISLRPGADNRDSDTNRATPPKGPEDFVQADGTIPFRANWLLFKKNTSRRRHTSRRERLNHSSEHS